MSGKPVPKMKCHSKPGVKSKEEVEYHARVALLGCVICGRRPVYIHHMRSGNGHAQRASHWDVMPLCGYHHTDGRMGEAIHSGSRAFCKLHGSEESLVNFTKREMIKEGYYSENFFAELEEKGLTCSKFVLS